MPSERQKIQATIRSISATVEFHRKRGKPGQYAMARAGQLLDDAKLRLAKLEGR